MTREQQRDQWLEERNQSVGASEVPTVLGCNPFDTPFALWARKTGNAPPKEQTEQMRMGHVMEPVIATEYCRETKRTVTDPGEFTIQQRAGWPFLHATLDRLVRPCKEHDMPGPLELKNVGARMTAHWTDGVPLYVALQLQAQMAVIGADWGSVAALLAGQYFVWQDMERDDDFIAAMLVKVEAFIVLVKTETPPEPSGADLATLGQMYPQEEPGLEVELPESLAPVAERWEAGKRARTDIAAAVDGDEATLKAAIGEAEYGVLPDGRRYSCRVQRRKEHTVKESTFRVLRRLKT